MLAVVATRLPVDLALTLRPLRWGGARDPTVRIGPDGVWRASRFASGPATVHLRSIAPGEVAVQAWGAGAAEAVEAAGDLLGASDDDGGHWVCFALAGTARGTDAHMLELLAPWAGQRGRVCRLIMSGGPPPPRFGPRLPLAPIAPL